MTWPPAAAFRAEFAEELRSHPGGDASLLSFAAALDAVRTLTPSRPRAPLPPAATAHLPTALAGLECSVTMAGAIRTLSEVADWYRILEGADAPAGLVDGLMVGRIPLPPGAPVRLGLFLLAPHLTYPLHQHAAEEIYYIVSGRLELQMGLACPPRTLAPGEHSVTPPNRVHALQTGDQPCMIAYCWTGRITEPSWWWEERGGAWWRTRWDRDDEGIWTVSTEEPVSAATMREAGEG